MPETPWRPTRAATIVIGLLTLWPFLYMPLFFGVFAFQEFVDSGRTGSTSPDLFKYILPLHCATVLLLLALTGIYVFHAPSPRERGTTLYSPVGEDPSLDTEEDGLVGTRAGGHTLVLLYP